MNKYILHNITINDYSNYNSRVNHNNVTHFKKKQLVLKKLVIYIHLHSTQQNKYLFVLLLLLVEKLTNVRISYIYSYKLKKVTVKIGYSVVLNNTLLHNYLIQSQFFSVYKLYNRKIKNYLNFSLNTIVIYKILFFSIYNKDLDYYDYFDMITNYSDQNNYNIKYQIYTINQAHYVNNILLSNINYINAT